MAKRLKNASANGARTEKQFTLKKNFNCTHWKWSIEKKVLGPYRSIELEKWNKENKNYKDWFDML